MEPLISRVYDLKVSGYDDAIAKVSAMTKAFKGMDDTKKKLNEQLQKKIEVGDAKSIADLTAQIKALQLEMTNLSKKRESSAKEIALLAQAEKSEAEAKLVNIKAEREKTKSIIDQEKEIDRLIAQEEKKAKSDARSNQGLKAQADNYYALLQAQRAALELYKITPSESPLFEQVKKGAVDAKAKVDAFNRSLSPDGTLVGEYKSGIVNAFKELGLGDFLKQQKNDIQNNLQQLIQKNQQLANEYRKTSKEGGEAFDKIDKELKESIALQQQMEANLQHINTALAGTGGIGRQITQSLSSEFKNLKTNIAQVAIGYVGFQAVLSGVSGVITNNLDFEKKTNELQAITGIIGKDLDFLKNKARETSSNTKFSALEILESYKLIASAKPELVGSADALEQVNAAGVRLAQASGTDLPPAINSLLDTLNQFGAGADQASVFVDALAAGAKFGAAEIPAISTALKEFGTQAKSSNVSIYESVGLIELLASKGIQGSEAGTKLRNVLLALNAAPALGRRALAELDQAGVDIEKLGDSTISLEERLTELAKVQDNNTALVKVFGKENFNAGQIVLKNIPAYTAFAKQVEATGVAQQQAGINTDTAATKFAKLGNQITNAFTSDTVVKTLGFIASALSIILNLPFSVLIAALATTIGLTNTWAGAKIRVLAAYALEKSAMVIEFAQLVVSNGIKATATLITNVYAAATIRSAAASGIAAAAYRVLAIALATLTSPFGIVLGLVVALTTVFGVFSASARNANVQMSQFLQNQKRDNEIARESSRIYGEQIAKIDSWVAVIKNAKTSADTKRTAVAELTKINRAFGDVIKDNVIDLNKLDSAYKTVTQAIIVQANAQATANLTAQKQQKVLELTTARQAIEIATGKGGDLVAIEGKSDIPKDILNIIKDLKGTDVTTNLDFSKTVVVTQKQLATVMADLKAKEAIAQGEFVSYLQLKNKSEGELSNFLTNQSKNAQGFEVDISDLKNKLATLDKEIDGFQGNKSDLDKKIAERKKLQEELDRLLGNKKAPGTGASKLTGEQKDEFKDIDAKRDEKLAAEKLKFTQLLEDEETYLRNVLKINITAADQKLKLLKGNNAEERKQIAELRLFKIDQEAETNKKIFDLKSKEVERSFDDAKKRAETQFNNVNDDPTKTTLEKLQARQIFLAQSLVLQSASNAKIDALEKQFGIKSEENEKKRRDAIVAIDKDIKKTQLEITKESYEEQLRLSDEASRKLQNEFKRNAAGQTIAVLKDNTLSDKEKAARLKQIEVDQTKNLLAAEEAAARIDLDNKQKGLATSIEISDAKTKLKLAELALTKYVADQEQTIMQKLTSGLKDAWKNLTGGFKASKEDIQATIAEASSVIGDTINQAKQNYFDNQRAQVDSERDIALQRLDLEQKQLEDSAETEEQKESIRKQFEGKRKQAEKQASEDKKQIALKEMALNFALAVVKTLAAYPFPFSLIPVAALTVQYLLARSQANAQKFAEGGLVRPDSVGNGRISNRPNIPTQSNGDNIFATVRTGEVILNENQQRRLGGARTFAAIGVPGFAAGGYTGGANLQAPVNPGGFLSKGSSKQVVNRTKTEDQIEALAGMVADVTGAVFNVSQRIDNIKVGVSAKEVIETNNKTKRASARGTI